MYSLFAAAALPALALAGVAHPSHSEAHSSAAAATTAAPNTWLSTSTVYSTSIHTVTSCEADVKTCPGHGKVVVVTEVVPVSTTVCPVTTTPTGGWSKPTTTPGGEWPKPPKGDWPEKDEEDDEWKCSTSTSVSTSVSTSTCVHTATAEGKEPWVVTTYLPVSVPVTVTSTICPVKPTGGAGEWPKPPVKPTGGEWPVKPAPSAPAGTWPVKPAPSAPTGSWTKTAAGPAAPSGTGSWSKTTTAGQAVVTAGAAENMVALKIVGAGVLAALML